MQKLAMLLAAVLVATSTVAAPPPKPKLIVAIAVDQFSAELFDRYRPGFTGGLARLARCVAYANGYQSHAATETCPGHSTVLTSMQPAATGIAATWYDVATGSSVCCVAVRGTSDPQARGPQNLRVDTLGDWLKHAEPGARTVAVSGKDQPRSLRAANMPMRSIGGSTAAASPLPASRGPPPRPCSRPPRPFDAGVAARWRVHPPALWPEAPAACGALETPHVFGTLHLSGDVPPDGLAALEGGATISGAPTSRTSCAPRRCSMPRRSPSPAG